jgi:hypothetical protein
MRSIVVRLHRAADLSATITAMRSWLDERGCSASSVTYDRSPGWFVITADIHSEDDANAFKNRFGGSEKSALPGTMANKASWWRLMAEEIRTEADSFSSASAKDTMLFAARTLDRMARDLERRLEQYSPSDREYEIR